MKIHGCPNDPRAIMTPAHPVWRCIRTASSGVLMSPLPSTGISSALDDGSDLIPSRSPAVHLRPRARVKREHPRAGILAPQSDSHWVAHLLAPATSNLYVTGKGVAAETARITDSTRSRSFRQPEPPLRFTTFFTGQPKLMSMNSG